MTKFWHLASVNWWILDNIQLSKMSKVNNLKSSWLKNSNFEKIVLLKNGQNLIFCECTLRFGNPYLSTMSLRLTWNLWNPIWKLKYQEILDEINLLACSDIFYFLRKPFKNGSEELFIIQCEKSQKMKKNTKIDLKNVSNL